MSDSFEFTLHSPLTQEDWNKISDAEHENTMFVTFQTPQGRQVRYIKCDVLDKIREEIEQASYEYYFEYGEYIGEDTRKTRIINTNKVLQIIDKYKADKEGDAE